MLQFILGTADSGKTDKVYADIRGRLDENKKSWIIVPEQFSLFTEKEILRRFGLPSQLNVKVMSFSGLCNAVLQHCGPLRMKYIDGAGKYIAAAATIENISPKLKSLNKNVRRKGFSKILVDTVSEFKRYGVTSEQLEFAAENSGVEELSNKLNDLALFYDEYNKVIEEHSADAEDNLSIICPKIKECSWLRGKMYIMYFRSFTPVELVAIRELMGIMDVCVVMDYSRAPEFSGIFSQIGDTAEILKGIAEEDGIDVCEEILHTDENSKNSLDFLKNRYFDYKTKPFEGECKNIEIYQVNNHFREVEFVADMIRRLCRTDGFKFSDFLILARDTERYNSIMPGIFERRGVHVFLDTRRSISSKPMVKLISGILDIAARGCSYERVMSVARSGLLDITNDDADVFENYILATAPSYAMWQEEVWEYVPARGHYDMDKVNHVKNEILSGVKAITDKISGTKTGGEIVESVLEWIKESKLSAQVEKKIKYCRNNDMPELADEYQQVWNATVSLLSQIAAIMKDKKMTYVKFADLFKEAISSIEIGITPQTLDGVVFGNIDRFRSSGAKVVIVLGLNEGVFPKGHITEGLISDGERQKLYDMGIELAPGIDAKRHQEQLLIYAVLTSATDRIILMEPLTNNKGEQLQPSEILSRVKELLPHVSVTNPDAEEDVLGGAEGELAAFDILARAMAEAGGKVENLTEPLKELYGYFSNKEEYIFELNKIYKNMRYGMPETLSEPVAESIYGKPLMLSASQIETYNSCAFKYFLTYGLMLKEREKAGAEPRSMGSVQHAALFDYFSYLKDTDADYETVTKEDCFKKVSDFVEEEAKKDAELLYESSAYFRYIVMRMKGIASRTAWEVVKFYKSSAFRPYGFEIRIGKDGQIPMVEVKDDNGECIAGIRGFIDRADITEIDGKNYVSIVDYKSSAKDLEVTLAKDGITIQPLLYADAVCKGIQGAEPAAMIYMQMNDPIIDEGDVRGNLDLAVNKVMLPKGWISSEDAVQTAYTLKMGDAKESYMPKREVDKVSAEELRERINLANEKIKESAMEIISGNIGINPYCTDKHNACAYCPYSSICNK